MEVNVKLIERSICLDRSSHSDCSSARRTLQPWEPHLGLGIIQSELVMEPGNKFPLLSPSSVQPTSSYVGNSEQLLWFHPTGGPGPSI